MKISLKTPYFLNENGPEAILQTAVLPEQGEQSAASRLFLVTEGIGGAERGDVAAQISDAAFKEYFNKVNPVGKKAVRQLYINETLRFTERRFTNHMQKSPAAYGMKSTMALVHFNNDNTATLAWVGNCRIYHIRQKQILYRSEDHISSTWQNGAYVLLPKTISTTDTSYASTHVINDILPGDYFLVCSPGVHEVLSDRNIKYLISQGDYTDATNQSIVDKVSELCAKNASKNISMYLVQVDGQPSDVAVAAAGSSSQKEIKVPKVNSTSNKTRQRKAPKALYGEKSETASIGKRSKIPLLLGLLALLIVGLGLGYKYLVSNPEEVFKKHYNQGTSYMLEGNYDQAITELEKAVSVKLEDTVSIYKARMSLLTAREKLLTQQGDEFIRSGDLLNARKLYEEILQLNPANMNIRNKLDNLNFKIETEKQRLITLADTLLIQERFKDAKELLYEALSLAPEDTVILKNINFCNTHLEEDSVFIASLEEVPVEDETENQPIEEEIRPEREERDLFANQNDPQPISSTTYTNPVSSTTYTRPIGSSTTTNNNISSSTNVNSPNTPSTSTQAFNYVQQGDDAFQRKNYSGALNFYERAYSLNKDSRVESKIRQTKQRLDDNKSYKNVISQADQAFRSGNYDKAKKLYWNALGFESADQYPSQKIEECNAQIETKTQHNKYIQQGDAALAAGNYNKAKDLYTSALATTNNRASVESKIKQVEAQKSRKEAELNAEKAAAEAEAAAVAEAAAEAATEAVVEAPKEEVVETPPPPKEIKTQTSVPARPKEKPKVDVRSIERFCKSEGYTYECYQRLKSQNAFGEADKKVLFRLGKFFEQSNDKNKAAECYRQSMIQGSDQARNRLRKLNK